MPAKIEQPGLKRHLVGIQRPVTQVVDGHELERWVSYADEVWASIEPLSGREFFAAQQVQADVTHRVRIWYLAGVKSDMRVVTSDSRALQLVGPPIDPDELHVELVLMCRETEL